MPKKRVIRQLVLGLVFGLVYNLGFGAAPGFCFRTLRVFGLVLPGFRVQGFAASVQVVCALGGFGVV